MQKDNVGKNEKKAPRAGFRRRLNPYYEGMSKKQIAADTAKTAFRWFYVTVFLFAYWFAMLLLASIFLVNVWKTTIEKIVIYSLILGTVSSAIYAGVLVHRKFYY